MATSVTFKQVVTVDGRTPFTYEHTITAESGEVVEVSVANGQTDKQVALAVDVSGVSFFLLHSDQDVTFETNDGSSADDSISLLAGKPYVWSTNHYDTFQLGTDVTTNVYITNASGQSAAVTIVRLQDATP